MKMKGISLTVSAKLFVIPILTLLLLSPTEAAKKCSRTLNRVPVHKDFKLDRFEGTWYTVTRTTLAWGENTFKSFSIEITKQDGLYHFSYTGQLGDRCLPVVSGAMEDTKRPGQYILNVPNSNNNHPTIIVSYTDYKHTALIYYCFKYRPGSRAQCHKNGVQVEVASKDLNPSKKDVNSYMKRAKKRLCASAKLLEATKPGRCQIPDILAAAKQRALDLKQSEITTDDDDDDDDNDDDNDDDDDGNDDDDDDMQCFVNNIPVQENFNSSQLHGLWYEIARTRFTFNKMESVMSFHRFDETSNKIYSYYTGTLVLPRTVVSEDDDQSTPPCMTAIQGMSKTREGTKYDSDRLGRIGWEDSSYPWAPTKVLYGDDEYTLLYACYSGPSDQPCVQEAMEVTLVGRSRNISSAKRDSIYGMLPRICIDPDDMEDTQFLTNCSSWVTIKHEDVEPEDCRLGDITVYDDYVNTQMAGTWYLYSSITYNSVTSLHGVVMKKTLTGTTDIIDTTMAAFSLEDDNVCEQYLSKSRDLCVDTGDHVTILPTGGDGNFVFSKVLYLDDYLLVEYTCMARTTEGICEKHGIQLHVYTTNDTSGEDFVLHSDAINRIHSIAKSVCLDPNDLQLETVWCNISMVTAPEESEVDGDCDLDQITVFSDMYEYMQERIYGYWYEVYRSTGNTHMANVRSAVAYFTSASNDTLNVYYTGLSSDNEDENNVDCKVVGHGSMLTRCKEDINGDFLASYTETDNYVSYVPFKIIYTDYVNVLVTYTCQQMLPSGQCSETGSHMRIWSRNTSLADADTEYAFDMLGFCTCLDPYSEEVVVVGPLNDNDVCRSKLEEYVTEHDLTKLTEEGADEGADYENEDSDEHKEQQSDQGRDKYQLSDIEAELLIDDEDFYY